jgi:hypothetical protein
MPGLRGDQVCQSQHIHTNLAIPRTIEPANLAPSHDRGYLTGTQSRDPPPKTETAGLMWMLTSIRLHLLSSQMTPCSPLNLGVSITALDLGAVLVDDLSALILPTARPDFHPGVTGMMATGIVLEQHLKS